MELKKDYSLTKDFDFKKNADVYNLQDDDYEYVVFQGYQFKNVLSAYTHIRRGVCGSVEEIIEYKETLDQYVKCFFELYVQLLRTNSIFLEENVPYTRLLFGIEEIIYVLICCMDRTADVAASTAMLLRKLLRECREYYRDSSDRDNINIRMRLSVCDTIEELLDLFSEGVGYEEDPKAYFRTYAAKKAADVLLHLKHKPVTAEAIASRTDKIMKNPAFCEYVEKFDVYTLRHASKNMANAIVELLTKRN